MKVWNKDHPYPGKPQKQRQRAQPIRYFRRKRNSKGNEAEETCDERWKGRGSKNKIGREKPRPRTPRNRSQTKLAYHVRRHRVELQRDRLEGTCRVKKIAVVIPDLMTVLRVGCPAGGARSCLEPLGPSVHTTLLVRTPVSRVPAFHNAAGTSTSNLCARVVPRLCRPRGLNSRTLRARPPRRARSSRGWSCQGNKVSPTRAVSVETAQTPSLSQRVPATQGTTPSTAGCALPRSRLPVLLFEP